MKNQPIFEWDAEEGIAVCILTDGQHYFTGSAKCHIDDIDMCSQRTGEGIAYQRATIEYLKFYRDTLKIQHGSLKQFYYSISQSTKFNSESYEVKMLRKHMERLEFDLQYAREAILEARIALKEFIEQKEQFYQKIRSNRKEKENV